MSNESISGPELTTESFSDALKKARNRADRILDEIDRVSAGDNLDPKLRVIVEPYLQSFKIIENSIAAQFLLIEQLPEGAEHEELESVFSELGNLISKLDSAKLELNSIITNLNADEIKSLIESGATVELVERDGQVIIDVTEPEEVVATQEAEITSPVETAPLVEPEALSIKEDSSVPAKPSALDLLPDNFFETEANRNGVKQISEIREELTSIFKEAGLSNQEIASFFKNKFQYFKDRVNLQRDIRRLQKTQEGVEVINQRIKEEYSFLLQAARELIQFDSIDEVSGANLDVPVESSESEVLERLDKIKADFNQIDTVYIDVPGYKGSEEHKAVLRALQALNDYQANPGGSGDKKDYQRRLEKYQNKLSAAVGTLADFVESLTVDNEVNPITGNEVVPVSPLEKITVIDASPDDILDSDIVKSPRYLNEDFVDVEPKVKTESVDIGSSVIPIEPNSDIEASAEKDTSAGSDPLTAFNIDELELLPMESMSKREVQYDKVDARGRWREAMNNYRASEEAYLSALGDYYNDGTWKARAGRALSFGKRMIGLSPELPPSLMELRDRYESNKSLYAKSLDAALLERGKIGTNKEYAFDAKAKMAFGSKFIVKPHEKLLKAQETTALSPEEMNRLQKTMAFMSKHKWHTRLGVVATAGIVGGLSGGVGLAVAGASWQAWKIAASAASGALAGKSANWATGFLVKNAEANFDKTAKSVKENFNLDDISGQSADYAKSFRKVDVAKNVQKTATIGAAVAAGGLTGYELGKMPEDYVSLVSEAVKVEPFATNIAIPYSGREGGYEHVISTLNLGEDFDISALPDGKAEEVEKFLRVKVSDYLDANVNMSEAKLEANLMGVLERKFGGEAWWGNANISKVDIGDIVLRKIESIQTTSGAESVPQATSTLSPFDEATPLSKPEYAYDVVKGDTLGEIILDKFKLQTSGFTETEKGELLARMYAKLEANPELVKQLGLRSGDIDLIYPGEKLNLEVIYDLIDKEGERMTILEDFRKSAPLTVEAETGVKNVPITVIEKPIPGSTAVTFEDATYTEAAPKVIATPEKPEIPVAPKITPLNGQYLDHPAYKDYLSKVFGSEDQAMREVLKSAREFDSNTYDIFDAPKGYESPYLFLSEQKLKDFDVFVKQNPMEIRAFLTENNMKYETYLAWVGKINELRSSLPANPNTTVGDLFGRNVALEAVAKQANNLLRK
jgi:hypothetical protein